MNLIYDLHPSSATPRLRYLQELKPLPKSHTNRMLLKSLLPLSLLVVSTLAGPSLQYLWPSNVFSIQMQSSSHSHPFDSITSLTYNVRNSNEVVELLEEFHTTKFAFTIEELDTHPEVNVVVSFLREPLQAVTALGSDIKLKDCTAITNLLETCAVWSLSATTAPETARPYLHAINTRVHRCVETLDKVKKQQHFLEQLTQRLVDGDMGFVIGTLPLPDSASQHEAPEDDFLVRVASFHKSAFAISFKLKNWNDEKVAIDEPLANIHKFFVGTGESLAAVVAKCDVGLAEELLVLLKDCQDERERLRRLL